MHIRDFLSPRDVVIDLRASNKDGVLRDLARRAGAVLNTPAEAIAAELLKRERLGSTGMGDGVAIPHARVAGVAGPFGLFARLKPPINFEAVDGRPVDLVFLLLAPESSQSEQINVLASLARRLREPGTLDDLRAAKDSQALYRRMTGDPKEI